MADGQRGGFGVDLNWRYVEGHRGPGFREQKPGDAFDSHAESGMESQTNPRAVLPGLQAIALTLNLERATAIGGMKLKREAQQLVVRREAVFGTFEGSFDDPRAAVQRVPIFAVHRVRGEMRKAALGSAQ